MLSASESACLSENEILSLFRGTLDVAKATRAQTHIDRCAECQELLALVVRASGDALTSGPRIRGGASTLARGTIIGRYRIREAVGAGAMGVVYLADDDELGRKVALKMLRAYDEAAAKRLRREAQAIARIAHPNVVVVYEVGLFEEQVFMAMEFVEGTSLANWLTKKRALGEILEVYQQAGRGLAVAHAAGLVHRDFKPDNVLVGQDGRVRVVDFGLARAESVPRPEEESSTDGLSANTPFMTLTRTGAFVGTPAYMAPEQYEGRAADARTDQFAFCVALYEAIYGVRPFDADSLERLVEVVKRGEVRPPSRGGVPAHVVRTIRKGLSVSPDERFATMDALLAELGRSSGRRGLVVGAAALAGAVACALAVRSVGTDHPVSAVSTPSVSVSMPSASAPVIPSATPPAALLAEPSAVSTPKAILRGGPTATTKAISIAPRSSVSAPASPEPSPIPNASASASTKDPLERRR